MPALTKILKVVPLGPDDLARHDAAEKELGVAVAVVQKRERARLTVIEDLKKKFDPDYQKNSVQQMSRYSAIVKDGCLVIMLD